MRSNRTLDPITIQRCLLPYKQKAVTTEFVANYRYQAAFLHYWSCTRAWCCYHLESLACLMELDCGTICTVNCRPVHYNEMWGWSRNKLDRNSFEMVSPASLEIQLVIFQLFKRKIIAIRFIFTRYHKYILWEVYKYKNLKKLYCYMYDFECN